MSAPEWTLKVGRDAAGGRVLVRARADLEALRRADLVTCVQVGLPIGSGGFPSPEEEAALERLQGEVAYALEPDGVLVAHATVPGLRRLFAYVAPTSDAPRRLELTLGRHGLGRGAVARRSDPAWATVRPFT